MACVGGPTREQAEADEKAAKEEREHLQNAQILLCEAGSIIEEAGLAKKMSPRLRSWLRKHEVFEMEKTKKEALKKLTAKERRALGYK